MSRYERKRYFDRLCEMRDAYTSSPDDCRGAISIEDVVIYAEAVMTALLEHDREAALELLAADAEAAADGELGAADGESGMSDVAAGEPTPPLGKFGPFGRFQGHPGRIRP